MPLARRELLARTGAALAAGTIGISPGWNQAAAQSTPQPPDGVSLSPWDDVRAQFALSDGIRPPERHAHRLPSQARPGCHRGAPARDGCQPARARARALTFICSRTT